MVGGFERGAMAELGVGERSRVVARKGREL